MKKLTSAIFVLMISFMFLTGCVDPERPKDDKFTPKLDITKSITLNVASFFGNFEAMDEVLLHFNEFYPNVKINREFSSDTSSPDFLKTNPQYDIFMTSNEKGYHTSSCVDLIDAGIDISDINEKVVEGNKYNGKLYTIPMSLNLKGMVVNKTLLKKEGLNVPETYSEFLNVLETLKNKGYTPIQGPNIAVSTICYNMGMSMLATDQDLYEASLKGDISKTSKLTSVFDCINTFVTKGYVNLEVNKTYPDNNYDGAILNFFEGNVPFWVCDTEKVSGMKKRESKSEAFKNNPFEYEFMFAPLGENGSYEYIEPWYGFAVNKDSERKDYAIEFLRFMARQDELNTLASIKGVPSIAKVSTDTRYANIGNVKVEVSIVNNGTIMPYVGTCFTLSANEFLSGNLKSADEALKYFLEKCKSIETK